MAILSSIVFIVLALSLVECQRPSFAGSRPIGYPELADRFKDPNYKPAYENVFDGSVVGDLENRFGADGTTQKLPVDALGDRYLVEMISRWPKDQQPFWFINAQQIEQHKGITSGYKPQNQPENAPSNGLLLGSPQIPEQDPQNLPTDAQIQENVTVAEKQDKENFLSSASS